MDKYYIVEITHAYKVPAKDAEEALEKFDEEPGMHEEWHEEAGYWTEVHEPYEAE